CTAALYRADAGVCAVALAAPALADARPRLLGAPLCADVEARLESSGLSKRRMGIQPVCLAVAVRVRRLVCARRRRAAAELDRLALAACAGNRLCLVRLQHRHDLVFPAPEHLCAGYRRRYNLPDRQ